ncbi:MAG: hypothetical protein IH968_17200 [Gemmatimonadetes bacterium]|nr:hypothetical protein [Gemmatimonadota bacterium]
MKIVILGAGSLAHLVASILSDDHNLSIVGFVDVEKPSVERRILGFPVIGDHSVLPSLLEEGTNGAIVAVGDNNLREQRFYALQNMGFEMVNVIHRTALIASDVLLKSGTIIAEGCILSAGVSVGNNVVFEAGAVISVNVDVGENVYVGPGVCVAGACTLKRNCRIEAGASVAPSVVVGKNAVAAPGAAVLQDLPDLPVAELTQHPS